jgi:NDP-sugar pyrophosphorylase family protein
MIAIILCAGRATRLKEETKDKPKCMVDICGKPVLERIANQLEQVGADRIIVNLSVFPEVVMKHFGQRFLYLYEPVPMGEFATVALIKSWFTDEDILVVNGDTLVQDYNPEEDKHCGYTWYYENGSVIRVKGRKFIDIGTPKGLSEARRYYAGN